MKKLILINAIIWATLILVSAYLFKDNPYYEYYFGGLIMAAAITNSLMAKQLNKHKKTNCL
ncbi:hypothetical protein [Aegicerativicinus sediminis]